MDSGDWLIISHKDLFLMSLRELYKYYATNKKEINFIMSNLISIYKIGFIPTISIQMIKYIFKNL